MDIKKELKNNWGFLLSIGLLLLLFFNTNARSFVTQQLLKIGLFSPTINTSNKALNTSLSFRNAKNEIINTADLKGKVVFINFWATWCPPCIAEMPSIETVYQQTKNKDIVFLMVEMDNEIDKAEKFMNNKGYQLPVYSRASAIPDDILDGTIPTTLVLDKTGKTVLLHKGMANYTDKNFIKKINELLK